MTTEQLTFDICNWMEPKPLATKTYSELDREDGGNYTNWNITSEKGWWNISIDIGLANRDRMLEDIPDWEPAKEPVSNIEDVFKVERKIKDAGLSVNYIQMLQKIVSKDKIFFGTCLEIFELIHATPEQRCRAAMIAVSNSDKVTH
jgi:hypothetical protein